MTSGSCPGGSLWMIAGGTLAANTAPASPHSGRRKGIEMKKLLVVTVMAYLLMVAQAQVQAFHLSSCLCDECHSQFDNSREIPGDEREVGK